MRDIEKLIVHFSATPEGRDVDISDIRKWHLDRGWDDVGYHYVVKLDGTIQAGRDHNTIGAHCYGHNTKSIGICFVGGMTYDMSAVKDTRTKAQKESLIFLLGTLKRMYPKAELFGHKDLRPTDCPGFDVRKEYKDLNIHN